MIIFEEPATALLALDDAQTHQEPATALLPLDDAQKPKKTPKPYGGKVIVLWDLDNKRPIEALNPYEAAQNIRAFASRIGKVVGIAAFANKDGLSFVPPEVRDSRKDLEEYYTLEQEMFKRHKIKPETPYVCGVCGNKKKTQKELVKHFETLHIRERQKKMNRVNQFKGAKRKKLLDKMLPRKKTIKYIEAAVGVIEPADRYKLHSELKRAGVIVNQVASVRQAADKALMGSMIENASLKRGVGTIVVGNRTKGRKKKLARAACAWLPWDMLETGRIDKDVVEGAFAQAEMRKKKAKRIGQMRQIFGLPELDVDGDGASYSGISSFDEDIDDHEDILDEDGNFDEKNIFDEEDMCDDDLIGLDDILTRKKC
ncbi:hypothetical protein SS1G_06576 [Sclerotinia sclerotiorum 1980 UF-70]|uniref:C2H2-type domain-containing protein n=2 Tax=Sclerotinia sclerotiorum (strain ATCC 18683 / 1980 / Ss-1) TaxID=665079 RepID=A7EMM7_SCLS1|nr:hypothetical protein SS1G_06576 [Sclerotinia sclerotiorum 1980 UF-70]APA14609.1 hypothetical protein sscle_13g093790 [Sclerotinia sclerotiorum 1980 UF-70]EDO04093.1 hypothetical protein SS1G_06576 [Sclerotinia sclerotiorum 1980 UF-70]